jgi:hypothetical protein
VNTQGSRLIKFLLDKKEDTMTADLEDPVAWYNWRIGDAIPWCHLL